jgi:hypothetical protein
MWVQLVPLRRGATTAGHELPRGAPAAAAGGAADRGHFGVAAALTGERCYGARGRAAADFAGGQRGGDVYKLNSVYP